MQGQAAHADVRAPNGFWNLYSRCYDSVFHLLPYRELLSHAFEALDLRPGMTLLDAGCGTGNFESFIAEKTAPSIRVEAIDFSPGMLAVAERKCAGLDYVRFTKGDLNDTLPYADGTFDRIVSINVLYAMSDADRTMRELIRVLTPGGVLVVTSPSPDFKVTALIADHFRRVRNITGIGRRMGVVLTSVWVLVTGGVMQWALSNFVIDRREAAGRYHSLDLEEMHALLTRSRREGLGSFEVGMALANQNVFATAVKSNDQNVGIAPSMSNPESGGASESVG